MRPARPDLPARGPGNTAPAPGCDADGPGAAALPSREKKGAGRRRETDRVEPKAGRGSARPPSSLLPSRGWGLARDLVVAAARPLGSPAPPSPPGAHAQLAPL